MVGFAQVLCEDYAPSFDAEGQAFARRIEGAGLHMARLLDDILKLSRVSVQEFTPTAVDLVRLVHRALCEIHFDISHYTIIVPRTLPEWGDEGLLKLALKNLLSNAIKYSRQNTHPVLEIGVRRKGGKRVYFVRDNGVGFDPADVRNLFKPFSRLHDQSHFEGNGIGLAIVRRVIERHRGRVWAKSAVGEGSTFFFTLDLD
jgi:signal transduction histidine kinase